ncbi:hypothetical protein JR316_0011432 [Psilocybe cubensis]|uniref:Uncharacterized protein n=2 Tax=Psilocybe cubensis TaxID=181762 RepID=A0A8H7XT75_PSICU|nr:hypothetical protein JR316_0011432 [Psilocybe cubensis]KAH9475872.1 hypothetical protein JR316_0011432 [Psilocybe cubensis]
MHHNLPLELVTEIVHCILTIPEPKETIGQNIKPPWDLIRSFTLSCREFRLIGLALWFRQLYIVSAEDLKTSDSYFPVLKTSWCRHIHCVQEKDRKATHWDLAGFTRLSSLRIDWLCIGVSDIGDGGQPLLKNLESQVKHLDIRGVRHPSPMLLMALVSPFRDLVTLKLDFLRIWCGLCHTCILVRLPSPSPAIISYSNGLGLPYHYSRVLFPLQSLKEVFIRLPDFGPGLPITGLSDKVNDNLWSGECDRCMSLMYEDESFRTVWVARKNGIQPGDLDKWSPYLIPPRLEKVEWKFWRVGNGKEMPFSFEEVDSDEEEDDESEVAEDDEQ